MSYLEFGRVDLLPLMHRSEAVCPALAKTVLILLKHNTSHYLAFDKVSVLLVQKCYVKIEGGKRCVAV